MDQEQLDLVCAAFYEFLESAPFKLKKAGPALKAFKKMMASRAAATKTAGTQDDSPVLARHLTQSDEANGNASPKQIPGLENRIKDVDQRKQEMDSRLNELLRQNQELKKHALEKDEELIKLREELAAKGMDVLQAQKELEDAKSRQREKDDELEKTQKEMQARDRQLQGAWEEFRQSQDELRDRDNRLDAARQELEKLQRQLDKAQSILNGEEVRHMRECQKFLGTLDAGDKKILAQYYDLDDMAIFLTQCGQFSRLKQCWQHMARAIGNGENLPQAAAILTRLLEIYNAATAEKASLELPKTGDAYNPGRHIRMGQDGNTVRQTLLPGLVNAGGSLQQHAVVSLL